MAGSPTDDLQETQNPIEALQQACGWLSAGGPHFNGGYTMNTDAMAGQHRASFGFSETPPKELHRCVNGVIRGVMKECGWSAKYFKYSKRSLEFTLVPWPLWKQEEDRLEREEYRQAARRRRVGIHLGPADDRTPEP